MNISKLMINDLMQIISDDVMIIISHSGKGAIFTGKPSQLKGEIKNRKVLSISPGHQKLYIIVRGDDE